MTESTDGLDLCRLPELYLSKFEVMGSSNNRLGLFVINRWMGLDLNPQISLSPITSDHEFLNIAWNTKRIG